MSSAHVFDENWARYDSWYESNAVTAFNEVRLARAALEGAPSPCLEVGVGTGRFAAAVGCEFGVDPSPAMARAARARGVEAAVATGESLPVRGSSLGSILYSVTLCFLDDPRVALAEARRALRPGGVLALCMVPAESPWGSRYAELAAAGHTFYSHARFYTVDEASRLAEEAGFALEWVGGTLSYAPGEPPRPEKPAPYEPGVHGFACIRARRRG